MSKRRIVITGMGLVTAFGNDVDLFYDNLLKGNSCVDLITGFDISAYPTKIASEIKNFDVGEYMDKKLARRSDKFIKYAIVASKKALEMANLDQDELSNLDKTKIGAIISSGMGGMQTFSDGVETIIKQSYRRLTPFFVPMIITNMAGALLAIDLNIQGPNYSISTACATSNYSIHAAAEEIRRGSANIMLAGGTEAPMSAIGLSGFVQAKALSENNENPKKASRPWDKNRDGFVMGEGAGVLILEELQHAKKRNAPIFAEYLGGAINCDAIHMTEPREDGSVVARCIEDALKDAGISNERINYINAHATSTIAGDLCEIKAVKKVFKNHCKKIKINATKSLTGHLLGAAGGVEAIACIKAINTNKLHPTINLEDPEEELGDLDPVANRAIEHKIDALISCSFGFGGHNSVIVLAPYKD
jgi:3-oxoacyl-[acyl-carrier-protein] synthase II